MKLIFPQHTLHQVCLQSICRFCFHSAGMIVEHKLSHMPNQAIQRACHQGTYYGLNRYSRQVIFVKQKSDSTFLTCMNPLDLHMLPEPPRGTMARQVRHTLQHKFSAPKLSLVKFPSNSLQQKGSHEGHKGTRNARSTCQKCLLICNEFGISVHDVHYLKHLLLETLQPVL